jgi:hypothetical protein
MAVVSYYSDGACQHPTLDIGVGGGPPVPWMFGCSQIENIFADPSFGYSSLETECNEGVNNLPENPSGQVVVSTFYDSSTLSDCVGNKHTYSTDIREIDVIALNNCQLGPAPNSSYQISYQNSSSSSSSSSSSQQENEFNPSTFIFETFSTLDCSGPVSQATLFGYGDGFCTKMASPLASTSMHLPYAMRMTFKAEFSDPSMTPTPSPTGDHTSEISKIIKNLSTRDLDVIISIVVLVTVALCCAGCFLYRRSQRKVRMQSFGQKVRASISVDLFSVQSSNNDFNSSSNNTKNNNVNNNRSRSLGIRNPMAAKRPTNPQFTYADEVI